MKGLVLDSSDGDLLLEHGRAAITDNEVQVVENVLLAVRGELKEIPLIGAEVRLMLGGGRDVMWAARAKKMMQSCGADVSKVSMTDDGEVTVE